ncbi:unnamed protein product [Arabidopsis lyrata]|nr:unnamed protein product [Arabidopsis lyrata]
MRECVMVNHHWLEFRAWGNSLVNLGDSNYSEEIIENILKIESVEVDNRADIECSSSEASVSAAHSLVLDDTSSCPDREADNVLIAEDEKISDVGGDIPLTSPDLNYTSPDLNYTNHVDIDTESFSGENRSV